MQKLLLVVEQVFKIRGRGTVLLPDFTLGGAPKPHPTIVTLKRPDGTSRTAEIVFGVEHRNYGYQGPPRPSTDYWREVPSLRTIEESDVPVGTEIWYEAE